MENLPQKQIRRLHGLDGFQIQSEAKCLAVSNDYDSTICEIWKSVGYNSGKWTNPYQLEDVERVVSTYYDLQLIDRSLAELDISKLSSGTQDERNAQILLINTVTERSSAEAGFVRAILEQLWYGTKDGRIKSARMLQPRKYDASLGNPKDEALGNTVEKYLKTGVIVVIGVGACVGLFYAARAFNLFSTATKNNNE